MISEDNRGSVLKGRFRFLKIKILFTTSHCSADILRPSSHSQVGTGTIMWIIMVSTASDASNT